MLMPNWVRYNIHLLQVYRKLMTSHFVYFSPFLVQLLRVFQSQIEFFNLNFFPLKAKGELLLNMIMTNVVLLFLSAFKSEFMCRPIFKLGKKTARA